MKTFSLEIVTPEKVAYKGDVRQISIPAYEGEMGVLPGHIDYLAMLSPGEIRIKRNDDLVLFAISGGFAEIHPKNVVILCETAESAEDIDIERANLAKIRAAEKLKVSDKSIDTKQLQFAIQRAAARLKVVSDLKKRKKRK
ncbi:MAG: F0F1 ATP synthase subunit epsilon [Elusimicrobia bacterium]|nr:F0F1 ATP synthase subunit epsilon [Elusimicrobiota bacterium]